MALLQIKDKEIEERKEKEQEMEVELKAAQEHVLILKDMLIKDDPITKTQIVYLSTSPSYALQNRFKVGGVESANHLTPRLRTYNSNRTVGDEQYFSDIFMVADYKNVEKRLESLVGRFRDKKSKEVYRMHYTNLKYIVEYLCERFDEDVDMVNEKLSTFIENLNTSRLRPVVPPPAQIAVAAITKLTGDGTIEQSTMASDSRDALVEKIEKYLKRLSPTRRSISRKEVFDAVSVRSGRREKTPLLEVTINKVRPDIKLTVRKNL